jgi:peptide/nickel transport system permease protein
VLLVLAAGMAPLVTRDNPVAQTPGAELQSPSTEHWFGTDEFGRDIYSRVIYGLRVDLAAGTVGVAVGALIGVTIGLVAGYWRGALELVLMRVNDGLLAFPGILLGLIVVVTLGANFTSLVLAISILNVPVMARLARAGVIAERNKEYVTAVQSLGARDVRILMRHILRNAMAALVVQVALAMAFSVLIEAGLDFLGLGIQPPEASLGGILGTSRPFMRVAPWYPIIPGLVLTIMVLSFNALADLINAILNPRATSR